MVGLMRQRNAWLSVTIAAAVLSAEIAQPLLARRQPIEFANAAARALAGKATQNTLSDGSWRIFGHALS